MDPMDAPRSAVTRYLTHHQTAFTIYAFIVSFVTYSCMYAFRKPFTVAHYSKLYLGGIRFKIVIIIAQMFGYALSKFAGILFISSLTRYRRGFWISLCISVSELSLVAFAVSPLALKPVFLFVNGLPLGLIWGLVFSFIEGRRCSDLLTTGMCISFIIASGAAKAVGKAVLDFDIPEFWMPAATGALFLPVLYVGAYLLERLPPPTEDDVRARTERVPMTGRDRLRLLRDFGPGISSMALFYMFLNAARDFRDNFAPELWASFGYRTPPSLFAKSEIVVGLVVMIPILCFIRIRSPLGAFVSYHVLIVAAMIGTGVIAAVYASGNSSGFQFMVLSGIGLHLAYIPFSNIIFELLLTVFKYKANSGFLMYLCDSLGYLASLAVVIVRDFASPTLAWSTFYINICYALAATGVVLMGLSLVYYVWRYWNWKVAFDDFGPPLLPHERMGQDSGLASI